MPLLLAALLLVAALYGQSVWFGFCRPEQFALGEAMLVADPLSLLDAFTTDLSALNGDVHGFRGDWHPVVALSYVIDGLLGGGKAWSFHLSNVVLLGLIGWLAAFRLPKGPSRWLVLVLVVAHPMQTASVLDVSARGELLLALFGTAALVTRGRWSFVCSLLAMASHPVGVLAPLLAVVGSRAKPGLQRMVLLGHAGAMAIWFGLRTILGEMATVRLTPILGSVAEVQSAPAHVWVYLLQLMVPAEPVFGRSPLRFEPEMEGVAAASLLIIGLALIRFKGSPGQRSPVYCTALVILPLLLGTGLLSGMGEYGEARLCWSVVGLAWLLVCRPSFQGMGWAMVPLWVGLSVFRVGDWSSSTRLWETAYNNVSSDLLIAHHLGRALVDTEPARAAGLLEQVTQDWDHEQRRLQAHRTLVDVYRTLGKDRDSLPHLARVADPRVPGTGDLLMLRCKLETRYGILERDYPTGTVSAPLAQVCTVAAGQRPTDASLQNAAGMEAAVRGDYEAATELFRRAVELEPDNGRFRRDLAQLPTPTLSWGLGDPLSPDPAAAR